MVVPFHRLLGAAVLALAAGAQEPAPAPKPEAKPPARPAVLELGGRLPADFTLRALDGKPLRFDDLRGKVVVLHFWSATCPYEVAAEPKLNKLSVDFPASKVVVLGIAANQNEIGDEPAAADFAKADAAERPYARLRHKLAESGGNHPVLADHGGVLGTLLGARSTPHCFVFDGQGALGYRGALDDDPKGKNEPSTAQYVRLAVDSLLAGEKVAQAETQPYG